MDSDKKPTVAVLGGSGMLGADLVKFLGDRYSITAITRENYVAYKDAEFDVFINANGNGRRFWANQHPREDFLASTVSVYDSLFDFKFKKYIYISTISVYEDPSRPSETGELHAIDPLKLEPYGFHKYLSERIVARMADDYAVLRCPIILGKSIKRGPFYDILNNQPLFITLDSKLQLVTTKAIAEVIAAIIERGPLQEIFNVGGEGTFPLVDLGNFFEKPTVVSKDAKKQVYEMDISKLKKIYRPKTSREYLQDFIKEIE